MNALHRSFVAIALASSFVCVPAAFAGHHSSDPALDQIDAAYDQASQTTVISGVIASIDGQTITLVVGSGHKKKNVEVTADHKTKITLDSARASLGKLHPGQSAQVTGVGVPAVRIDAVSH